MPKTKDNAKDNGPKTSRRFNGKYNFCGKYTYCEKDYWKKYGKPGERTSEENINAFQAVENSLNTVPEEDEIYPF